MYMPCVSVGSTVPYCAGGYTACHAGDMLCAVRRDLLICCAVQGDMIICCTVLGDMWILCAMQGGYAA